MIALVDSLTLFPRLQSCVITEGTQADSAQLTGLKDSLKAFSLEGISKLSPIKDTRSFMQVVVTWCFFWLPCSVAARVFGFAELGHFSSVHNC